MCRCTLSFNAEPKFCSYSVVRGTDEGSQLKVGGSSDFDVVYAGFWNNTYQALEDRTYFWVDSQAGPGEVYRRRVTNAEPTLFRFTNPPDGFSISVRCVMD
jgi:hypothetical protein